MTLLDAVREKLPVGVSLPVGVMLGDGVMLPDGVLEPLPVPDDDTMGVPDSCTLTAPPGLPLGRSQRN